MENCQEEPWLKERKKWKETRRRCNRWRTRTGSFESTTRGVFAIVVEEKNAGSSSAGDVAKEPFQQVGRRWDC